MVKEKMPKHIDSNYFLLSTHLHLGPRDGQSRHQRSTWPRPEWVRMSANVNSYFVLFHHVSRPKDLSFLKLIETYWNYIWSITVFLNFRCFDRCESLVKPGLPTWWAGRLPWSWRLGLGLFLCECPRLVAKLPNLKISYFFQYLNQLFVH